MTLKQLENLKPGDVIRREGRLTYLILGPFKRNERERRFSGTYRVWVLDLERLTGRLGRQILREYDIEVTDIFPARRIKRIA
jgi:hypothetical protein